MASQGGSESISTLFVCGRFNQARERLLESLALNPADASTIRTLARLEHLAGDTGRANHWLDRLAAVAPEDPPGIALRGLLRARAGDRTQAAALVAKAQALAPNNPSVALVAAEIAIAIGAPAATAVSTAERAVAVTLDHPEALFARAWALAAAERTGAAINDLVGAIEREPRFARAYLALHGLLVAGGKSEAAARLLAEGRRHLPWIDRLVAPGAPAP